MKNSTSAIEKRLENLRESLKQKDVDAAFVTQRESYIYLSGFTGTSAFLFITRNDAILLTDFRYVEQASYQAPLYSIVQYQGSLIDAINNIIKEKGINKLGFEEANLTYSGYSEYKSKLEVKEFEPLEGAIEKLRLIKDESEIGIITKAVEIADNAFTQILDHIQPGIREIELAAELEYIMKKLGAKGQSFDIIVASGERSSMPHGVASERKLQLGDTITMDYGAIYNDYCSDMTRTVFLGKPSEDIKKIYNIVLNAQLKSIEGARKGMLGREIDFIARDIISKAGYEKNFGHGLGHGVGLEIHEEPRLSPAGNKIMENGMVVTAEPGIYVSGLGGVRIEDMIIINNDNPLVLTKSTKEMIII